LVIFAEAASPFGRLVGFMFSPPREGHEVVRPRVPAANSFGDNDLVAFDRASKYFS
jgi:hypothetical protein